MKKDIKRDPNPLYHLLKESLPEEFLVDIDDEEPVYTLDIASRIVDVPLWTLRTLIKEGIVNPKVESKKKMYFCKNDLKLIEYTKYLMEVKGVNVKGVRMIFEMKTKHEE